MMYCGMRGKLPPELDGLLTSELMRAIREGDETARKQFAEAAEYRIGRVENCCAELRRML